VKRWDGLKRVDEKEEIKHELALYGKVA